MQANATKVQRRLIKPLSAVQQAADVIERVLATEAEDYLETSQHLYTWWQLAMLDVYLLIMLIVVTFLGIVGLAFWLVLKCLFWCLRGSQKPKRS